MPEIHEEPDATDGDDLAALRALADRTSPEPVAWEQPPGALWARIAGGAGVPSAPGSVGPSDADRDRGGSGPLSPITGQRARPPSRPRTRLPWVLATAAVIVVAIASLLAIDRSEQPSLVASTRLARLGRSGSGDAELVRDHGKFRLEVRTAGLDAGNGFLEVWIIDAGVRRLVSLGPLRSDGAYDLPSRLDPEKYPIVDVSVEPLDGNPAHSSTSVLRGRLKF